MTSAFGGQRSIQLSYGCGRIAIATPLRGRNAKTSAEQIVAQFQRVDQHIDLFDRVIDTE